MKINLLGVEAEVTGPYAEGHTLNAIEASVLNQTWKENVGNNVRKAVAALFETEVTAEDGTKSTVAVEKTPELIQKAVDLILAAAAEYSFSERKSGGGRRVMDAFEKECRAIAKEMLTDRLSKQGIALKDVAKEDAEAKITEWAAHPKVQAAAKKALDARAKLALEDI